MNIPEFSQSDIKTALTLIFYPSPLSAEHGDEQIKLNKALALFTAELERNERDARIDQMNYVEQRLIGENTSGERVFYDKETVIAENRLKDRQRVISGAMKAELQALSAGGGK